MQSRRSWDVLLLGGASGTGKTRVSYRIARRFEVGITEVDDLYIALERTTTPEQQPVLHYWRTHLEEAARLTAEQVLDLQIRVSRVLSPAIEAVIANHLETRTPVVLDGDYLLPELMQHRTGADDPETRRAAAVFLYEPDEAQILKNFSAREPDDGEQAKRARVSWLFEQWLEEECRRYGLPALPARPWDTLIDRIGEVTD